MQISSYAFPKKPWASNLNRFIRVIFLVFLFVFGSNFLNNFIKNHQKIVIKIESSLTHYAYLAIENWQLMKSIDYIYPQASISRKIKKMTFFTNFLHLSYLSLGTLLPDLFLRFFIIYNQEEPFYYEKGLAKETPFFKHHFSILSWNICFIPGCSISSGGVLPVSYRIDKIIEKLREQDADIVLLFELFDATQAFYIKEKLSDQYTHFYLNIGPQILGLSSGIFIATKLHVSTPKFTSFPTKGIGAAKYIRKGFFSFDIKNAQKEAIRIYSTHMQHSLEPQHPKETEIALRKTQATMILNHIKNHQTMRKGFVLAGDLNADDPECCHLFSKQFFECSSIDTKTWSGDSLSNQIFYKSKKTSHGLNLDHILILKGGNIKEIQTSIVKSGYREDQLTSEALSDHQGLYSKISTDSQVSLER